MSEIKPVVIIKTWQERLQGAFYGHDEEIQCRYAEAIELRAAYEALQKENEAQAKRIAELEDKVIGLEAAVESLSCDVSSFCEWR